MANLSSLVGRNSYRIGDSGAVVTAMQLRLRDIGYPLKGTGYWANATDTAVRAFQKRAGLKVDGVLGEGTAKALDAAVGAPNTALPAPAAKALVAEIGRPLWLQAGLALVGTKEGVGARDNPVILAWAGEVGGQVAKDYTHDEIPWCKLFWELCLSRAGLHGNDSLWALDGAKWGVKLDGPAVGATMPMLRNGGGHIAFVVGKDQHGNLMCLGGNQSDAVNIKPFPPDRLYKPGGFRWPEGVPLPAQVGIGNLPVVSSDGVLSSREN